MSSERPSSFMDRNTILAVIVVMVAWVGWQKYLEMKYPNAYKKGSAASEKAAGENPNESEAVTEKGVDKGKLETAASSPGQTQEDGLREMGDVVIQEYSYEDATIALKVTNKGLGITSVSLQKYPGNGGQRTISLGGTESHPLYETQIVGGKSPLVFKVDQPDATTFVGQAVTEDGSVISKTLKIRPDSYAVDISVEIEHKGGSSHTLRHTLVEKLQEKKKGSFLVPSYDHQDIFVVYGGSDKRIVVDPEKPIEDHFEQVKLATVGGSYFMAGLIDKSDILPSFSGHLDQVDKLIVGYLDHQGLKAGSSGVKLSMTGYLGPKQLELLDAADPLLRSSVDFGWFSSIGFFLLKLLKSLYSVFPNYGVAIILLTLIVRLLVLPFNISSYRSMKKMQTINPLLKSIREKYKEDPQTLNAETMRVMKENRVNPLGGCLPMLIQLPIFITLYRVFGQSIELYHSPFILWIKDLSVKDPYYVLPILMGATMFMQQKLTPTTMDPAQAKVMAFLPLVFSFLMLSLPSSLTLYIFVSTLFGVLQQMVFLRDSRVVTRATAPTAKA